MQRPGSRDDPLRFLLARREVPVRLGGLMMWRWTRISSVKWEDSWMERLQFLGPEHVVFTEWPGGRTLKIEAFTDEATACELVKRFGGQVVPDAQVNEAALNQQLPRRPVSIRGKLRILTERGAFESGASATVGPRAIFVPAGMAFGTGEHATTAGCLRMLCDVVDELPSGWTALDAGCGSGILAIGASVLGAAQVDAFDFDSHAVRTAKANVRLNRCEGVVVTQQDIHDWKATRKYDVVLANLFSDLLIASAPRLTRAIRAGGVLIFSGVLKSQLPGVVEALELRGLMVDRTVARGKWCAGISRKPRVRA